MQRRPWLERVLHVTSWITIAGTAVWILLLPVLCNWKLFGARYYTLAPWSKAFAEPEFWKLLALHLLPAAAVLLVMSQGLRVLARVRRGELFCAANVQALRIAGGIGLAAAAWVLVTAVLSLPMPVGYYVVGLLQFSLGSALLIGTLSGAFVQFGFCFMGGLFCLLLAQFLRRGLELQEDSDLTI